MDLKLEFGTALCYAASGVIMGLRDDLATLQAENEKLREHMRELAATQLQLKEALDALDLRCGSNAEERKTLIPNLDTAMGQLEKAEPVGEVYRYGKDSHGREWHGIHWYDPNLDVPTGTKLYTHPAAPGEKK